MPPATHDPNKLNDLRNLLDYDESDTEAKPCSCCGEIDCDFDCDGIYEEDGDDADEDDHGQAGIGPEPDAER